MSFENGAIIDNRYLVSGVCSDSGGMGEILHIQDTQGLLQGNLVLKYCREEDEEHVKRFKREVRLLSSFNGNSKVVEVLDANTDHEPPYFVMPFYSEGDLSSVVGQLQNNPEYQLALFNSMIDCISELHVHSIYHRDIKPQNFLLNNGNLLVSDFGLGMEPNSTSRFTSSSMFWGTQGYLPPEFQNGGFKYADERGDIFMLGKSFYVLLTQQNPAYLMSSGLHPALFHVISKACDLNPNNRYQSLPEFKQALQITYDVILGRGGHLSEANQLIASINDRIENEAQYEPHQINNFFQKLFAINTEDQIRICLELKPQFFSILSHPEVVPNLSGFLEVYQAMIESDQYGWSFAEIIADNLRKVFNEQSLSAVIRAKALQLSIDAAYRMNRFAAMDTCVLMITSVSDNNFGQSISAIIQANPHDFITDIEPAQCKCESIRNTLIVLNNV